MLTLVSAVFCDFVCPLAEFLWFCRIIGGLRSILESEEKEIMKKLFVGIVLAALTVAGMVFLIPAEAEADTEFLRIHIRANSNEEIDQEVKLDVKNAVVEFLIPVLADADSKEEAEKILAENVGGIAAVADKTLIAAGFSYGARAEVRTEEFPTRAYGELTLPSGVYDALVVELGTGTGDNWWCVAFPPLCFTPNGNSKNIIYKSKILEIIERWTKNYAEND